MPVAEEQQEQEEQSNGGGGGAGAKGALTTAAVAAATGAAVYGVRKALTKGDGDDSPKAKKSESNGDGNDDDSGVRSVVGSAASSAWDSASHAVVPMAEEAADAAGAWVAEHAPDIVRERIIPRFIKSFNDAT